jgi:hypothetical protein
MASYPPPPSYPGYPGGGAPVPQGPRHMPSSVHTAVILMWAGGALELLGILLVALNHHAVRVAVIKAANRSGRAVNINAAVAAAIAIVVIGGLIYAGLWAWMAVMNSKGKNWARITGTVFWGIDVLLLIVNFLRPNASAVKIFALLIFVLGGVAVFLLWRPDSSPWFTPSPYQGTFG